MRTRSSSYNSSDNSERGATTRKRPSSSSLAPAAAAADAKASSHSSHRSRTQKQKHSQTPKQNDEITVADEGDHVYEMIGDDPVPLGAAAEDPVMTSTRPRRVPLVALVVAVAVTLLTVASLCGACIAMLTVHLHDGWSPQSLAEDIRHAWKDCM